MGRCDFASKSVPIPSQRTPGTISIVMGESRLLTAVGPQWDVLTSESTE